MCGIAGIIYKDGSLPQDADMRKMLNVMIHRGPDAEGIYSFGSVLLGHRRLSIIDTSSAGNQPMHYKNFTIVSNGEVYNYIEIKQELQNKGHLFVTRSDTEVILHAYEEWGEDSLNRFTGMWAFAIYDKEKKEVFFSRDRFGIKPFYYYNDQNKFIFASEIKVILSMGIKPKVNMDVLMAYLVIGLEDYSDKTFFNGINQLLPGQKARISLDNGEIGYEKYYDISKNGNGIVEADEYGRLLNESIQLHLRSDVPVGTCLSGGLDSSSIAAVASRIKRGFTKDKFVAITAQSESSINDESSYARQVVEHCNLDWHLVKPTYEDFAEEIEGILYSLGEPVVGPSVFMQYWVMKAAKEAGLKVVLDGQGGDETLLGYERYYPAIFWYCLLNRRWLYLMRELFLSIKHSMLTSTMLAKYIIYFSFGYVRKKILIRRTRFLKAHYVQSALKELEKYNIRFKSLRALQSSEIMKYQLPHLLRYEDRNSMALSIEARVPFVDHRCVEAAISLEPSEKIRNGFTKFALRQLANQILPQGIAWRRNKIGFEAPGDIWFKKHNFIMQEKINKSPLISKVCNKIPQLSSTPLNIRWRLYNVAIWEAQYNVES
jgi:asparagine synthase (glutamine-hydrolysing)